MEGSRGKKETAENMESLPPALLQLTGDVVSRLPAVCILTAEGSDGKAGLRSNRDHPKQAVGVIIRPRGEE